MSSMTPQLMWGTSLTPREGSQPFPEPGQPSRAGASLGTVEQGVGQRLTGLRWQMVPALSLTGWVASCRPPSLSEPWFPHS